MKVAICDYPPLAQQVQQTFTDIEFKFFVGDFVSNFGMVSEDTEFTTELPLISFFEFRRLVQAGELDGIFIAEYTCDDFTSPSLNFASSIKYRKSACSAKYFTCGSIPSTKFIGSTPKKLICRSSKRILSTRATSTAKAVRI